MRHLPAQLIIGMPWPDAGDSLAVSLAKAILFRAALAFLTASVYPASAAAPTCTSDIHGRPAGVSLCIAQAAAGPPNTVVAAPMPAAH